MSKALNELQFRISAYDMNQYKWNAILTLDENRGVFLNNIVNQFLGTFIEMRISEYDPTSGALHLPVGGRVDWINDNICVEQKRNPATDNASSKKANIKKLVEYAEEHNLVPVYAYSEDRRKNNYMKDGVLHLHGVAIFEYLGIGDRWCDFNSEVESVKITIKNLLVDRFNAHFQHVV